MVTAILGLGRESSFQRSIISCEPKIACHYFWTTDQLVTNHNRFIYSVWKKCYLYYLLVISHIAAYLLLIALSPRLIVLFSTCFGMYVNGTWQVYIRRNSGWKWFLNCCADFVSDVSPLPDSSPLSFIGIAVSRT